jgi:hypothetical protein
LSESAITKTERWHDTQPFRRLTVHMSVLLNTYPGRLYISLNRLIGYSLISETYTGCSILTRSHVTYSSSHKSTYPILSCSLNVLSADLMAYLQSPYPFLKDVCKMATESPSRNASTPIKGRQWYQNVALQTAVSLHCKEVTQY